MFNNANAVKAATEFIRDMADHVSMPDVYHKIRYLIEHQDSQIMDFVDAIKDDSMLSVKLSQITNSQYFGFPRRANDLYHAISLIGIIQLHDLILNCLSLRTFSAVPHQIFNFEEFWKYGIQCGIAARTIAQHSQIFPIQPYFTYGLLHEIGHAAMFAKEPERSLQTLGEEQDNLDSLIDRERELFGFDYTHVGLALIRQWHLPEVYQQVAAFHLKVEQADKQHQPIVRVVHLAHVLCQTQNSDQIQDLLQLSKEADHQLRKLPDNIAEIITKEIEANSYSVLKMLWPVIVQKSKQPQPSLIS